MKEISQISAMALMQNILHIVMEREVTREDALCGISAALAMIPILDLPRKPTMIIGGFDLEEAGRK